MFWLGIDPRPIKHTEIGAHLRYQDSIAWLEDMRCVFEGLDWTWVNAEPICEKLVA